MAELSSESSPRRSKQSRSRKGKEELPAGGGGGTKATQEEEEDELDLDDPKPKEKKLRHSAGVESNRKVRKKRSMQPPRRQSTELVTEHPVPLQICFSWNPTTLRYRIDRDTEDVHTWQWTRHFLKRVNGDGEWIVEGSIPEPIVMFLQIMRHIRRVDPYVL